MRVFVSFSSLMIDSDIGSLFKNNAFAIRELRCKVVMHYDSRAFSAWISVALRVTGAGR